MTMTAGLRTSVALAVAVAAAVMTGGAQADVLKIPSCPAGSHFRSCWRACEEKVCGNTDPVDAACLAEPMACAMVVGKASWTDEETVAFQQEFCRCDDLDAIFDKTALTCVANQSECSDDSETDDKAELVSGGAEEDTTPTCPKGMEYRSCGSSCVKTCGSPAPGPLCISECKPGCFCKKPGKWYDPVQDRCVRKKNCSPGDQ